MSATTKSISAEHLAKTVGINRKSALLFQHKVCAAMASDGDNPMNGEVKVDDALIGGYEPGKIGRGTINGNHTIGSVISLILLNKKVSRIKTSN
jgi:hypothetical protein